MTLRLAAISVSASADSVTAAPWWATAITSAKLAGPVPTMTVVLMPPIITCPPGHGELDLASVHGDEPGQDLAPADAQALVLVLVGHPGPQAADGGRGTEREPGGHVEVVVVDARGD